MVRLKDTEEHNRFVKHQFQFHYGTIKSALRCYSALAYRLFQFHYGTIKSLGELVNAGREA